LTTAPSKYATPLAGSRPTVALWVAICAGAGLRFAGLGQKSLWIDELASLVTATPHLGEIPAQALRNNAFEPPLYFWLLHLVNGLLGSSEISLRLLSALAGSVTIPIMWALTRELTKNDRIATLTALLLAVNPLHLWYSQEARPYALLLCLGSGALLCLSRALHDDHKGWWAGFVVFSALAMLSHATGVLFPMIGGFWALHSRGLRVVPRLALAAAGTLFLTSPFLVMLVSAVRHATGTGSPPRPLTGLELPYTILTFVGGYSFGPPVREIQDLGWRIAVTNHWLQTGLVALLLLCFIILVARARHSPMFALAILFLVPLAATLVGSLITTKAYNVRYTLPALLGFLALVSEALDRLPALDRRVALCAVAGLFCWADIQWFTSSPYWKEDSRAAAACLTKQLPPGSTVAVSHGYVRSLLQHYTPRAADFRFVVVDPSATPSGSAPRALAIARLDLLPATTEELVRSFRTQVGDPIRIGWSRGYRLYFASDSRLMTLDALCRQSDFAGRASKLAAGAAHHSTRSDMPHTRRGPARPVD
jgi:mannosyltransferase